MLSNRSMNAAIAEYIFYCKYKEVEGEDFFVCECDNCPVEDTEHPAWYGFAEGDGEALRLAQIMMKKHGWVIHIKLDGLRNNENYYNCLISGKMDGEFLSVASPDSKSLSRAICYSILTMYEII